MLNLTLWLKKNRYRADQVQTFLPSPMAVATAMYHTGVSPLRGVRRGGLEAVESVKGLRQRRKIASSVSAQECRNYLAHAGYGST
jgi:radical SAM superfamily enzyme YgiQ (UPF0313 family)